MKCTALYFRKSTDKQTHRSQLAGMNRWVEANPDTQLKEYRDSATGKDMDRPAWNRLWRDVESGKVDRIVVWRLDRLGRTAAGLTTLFETLQERGVSLVSLHEAFDLGTPSGRLMAGVLASVAQFETEVRSERVRAGIQAAKDEGKVWGGRKEGSRNKTTSEKAEAVKALHASGQCVSAIARSVGLSRPTVYSLLG